jgi:mRNA interferase RelE/StbE
LAWQVELTEGAKKDLARLDKPIAKRITEFLRNRVSPLENPRSLGHALTGSELGEFWRYRIGDFRVICQIQDKVLRILVIRIGNRREIYR